MWWMIKYTGYPTTSPKSDPPVDDTASCAAVAVASCSVHDRKLAVSVPFISGGSPLHAMAAMPFGSASHTSLNWLYIPEIGGRAYAG